jgi:hypothetical protein
MNDTAPIPNMTSQIMATISQGIPHPGKVSHTRLQRGVKRKAEDVKVLSRQLWTADRNMGERGHVITSRSDPVNPIHPVYPKKADEATNGIGGMA